MGFLFTDFPFFLPQLIFHHLSNFYLYPTSSLLPQEETKRLISTVMTPSLLFSSLGPNVNRHRCECGWLRVSLFTSCYCTKHTWRQLALFSFCIKPWKLFHSSMFIDTTHTFIKGNIPLYGCVISLTDFLSFATIYYNCYL